MDLKRLIWLKAATGSGVVLVEKTATGNPAEFTAQVAKNLKSLVVPLTLSQSGSGDPAPDNVRPISGISGLTCTHNETDLDITFPDNVGAVYGGSLDLVSGVLTIDWAYKLYTGASDEDWKTESISAGRNFYIATPSEWKRNTTSATLACNLANSVGTLASGVAKISASGNLNVCIGSIIDAGSIGEFKTWLAENNLQIAVKLNNPITVRLDHHSIKAIKGTNTVSTNTTGDLTVKYYDKP